ncbi:hypothetical protein [Arthrobacter sp. HLT1-21]
MTPELITALLGTGGLALIVPKIIDGLKAWRSGRAAEEKTKNKSLVERLAAAESKVDAETKRADGEAKRRRATEEYAGGLRVQLIGAGIPAADLPPWPRKHAD